MNGVLVLDKPAGMSSALAVDAVKKRLGASRAGHGGTLDPIATGVLPICLGEATKIAQYLLADDKAYEADLLLGVETDTLDRTGTVTATRPVDPSLTREAFEAALAAHRGEQDQIPPMYSAIKLEGVRMYQHARAGVEIERAPRRIRIDQLELLAWDPPHVRIAIACSKGTYVRSLVADLGTHVGTGAHMTELRRTRSGVFTLAQAHDLDRLDNPHLVPMTEATRLPTVVTPDALLHRVRSGVQLPPEALAIAPEIYKRFQIVDESGVLVAIGHIDRARIIYDRVFKP
jgi:tRNA pseudouridine55 synthase